MSNTHSMTSFAQSLHEEFSGSRDNGLTPIVEQEVCHFHIIVGQYINNEFDYKKTLKSHLEWVAQLCAESGISFEERIQSGPELYAALIPRSLLDKIRARLKVIVVFAEPVFNR